MDNRRLKTSRALSDLASTPVKHDRNLLNSEALGLQEKKVCEDKVAYENGNVNSIAALSASTRAGGTHYFHARAASATGLTNWLNELPRVATEVKSARPFVRMLNGRISTVYAMGRGVKAIS